VAPPRPGGGTLGQGRGRSGLSCRDAAGEEQRQRGDDRDDGERRTQRRKPRLAVLVDNRVSRCGVDAGRIERGAEVGEESSRQDDPAAVQALLCSMLARIASGVVSLDALRKTPACALR
jgi:hypothetical protein